MVKRLLFVLIIGLASISGIAQNYNATAFNINGEKRPLLFKENAKGEIVYSEIINLNADAAQIRQSVKNYINDQKGQHNLDVTYEVDNSQKLVAKIVYPINKTYWAVEIWGSPVVSGLRDASRNTFKCTVEFLNNKFRYTFSDFWTDNQRISGEAKDNGPTNVIYQQRLNSLQKVYDDYASSHNAEKRSVKEKLYDYQAAIDFEKNQYACEYASIMDFINGLKKVKIFDANGDFEQNADSTEDMDLKKPKALDLSNYHGNLLAKGNCVYVNDEGLEPYEQAGVQELVKQITIDGFWKVVPLRSMAHFVLEYHMSTEGRDHAWLELHSVYNSIICKDMPGNHEGSSESLEDNHESARSLYFSVINPLYDKIEKNKGGKVLSMFECK